MVLRVAFRVFLADQRKNGALDRGTGDVAVGGGRVAHDDRPRFENRAADRLRGVEQPVCELCDRLVARERLEPLRTGLGGERLGESTADGLGLLALQEDERLGLDLHVAPVALDLTVDPHRVADLDVRVRADTWLDERGHVDDTRLVENLEDGRAAGLSNADNFAVNPRRIADGVGEGTDLDALALVVEVVVLGGFVSAGFVLTLVSVGFVALVGFVSAAFVVSFVSLSDLVSLSGDVPVALVGLGSLIDIG